MTNLKLGSIKYNIVMKGILSVSSLLFPLITFPYVSRILMPTGMGKYNFANSVISYFAMFAQLGTLVYGTRCCAQVRDDREKLSRTVHELLFINIITTLLTYIVFIISIFTVNKFIEVRQILVVTSFLMIFNIIGMEWLYTALEKFQYITIRSLFFKVIALIATFLIIKKEEDYILYAGISLFALSAPNVLNFYNSRKYIDYRNLGNYKPLRHIKSLLIFFSVNCAAIFFTNLDSVMLGFMKSDEDVGYYYVSVKIETILVALVSSIGNVLLTRASYFVEQKRMDDFRRVAGKALILVAYISVPCMIYFIIFARQSVLFLSGKDYEQSIVPMIVLMPILLIKGLKSITELQMLIPLGREKQVLYSVIIGAIVDVILNIIFIPKFAALGAAIGTLLAELVVFLVQIVFLHDEFNRMKMNYKYTKLLFANLMAIVGSIWIIFRKWGVFVTLVSSSILYFSIYILLLVLVKDSVANEVIKSIIEKVNSIKNKG